MNLLAPISDIMTTDVISVSPNTSLSELDTIFEENSFHHIPVKENGKLVGMVSKSDILLFKRGFGPGGTADREELFRLKSWCAADIMTRKLAKLDIDDRINVALEVFKVNLFHALPVLKDDKLVGIVTTLDIIKHLAEDAQATNEYE